jgi:release factor glutamine methyltransferase
VTLVRRPVAATVGGALARGIDLLRARGDGARYDATLLLADALGRDPAWILAHGDEPLAVAAAERFDAALARRAEGEPVPYIVGSAGFFGRVFAVDRNVLVPRPETEAAVEAALAHLRAEGPAAPRVCDVGTGSGVIAITLACELPEAHLAAIDVSLAALAVAERNAQSLGVAGRIAFRCAAGLPIPEPDRRYAAIVANLPYVKSAQLRGAPDPTSFEPRIALDGGADGLDAYRDLLAAAPCALAAGGLLVMEAGPDTVPALAALAAEAFADAGSVSVRRDLAGLDRLVLVRARS